MAEAWGENNNRSMPLSCIRLNWFRIERSSCSSLTCSRGRGGLAQIHDLAAAIGLQLRRCAGVVRMCIDNHSGTLLVGALGDNGG